MIKSIIVAVAENNIIGRDNDLVWRLPDDMKYFRRMTSGHCVIMGRKTFESFGKPLPNRTHIIITRNDDYQYEGCHIVNTLEDAFAKAKELGETEAFILGGGEIYRQSIVMSDKLYITEVHESFDGDTSFPEIDKSNWKEISRDDRDKDEQHAHDFSFVVYERA